MIIPAFGRTDLLERTIRSVIAQDLDPGSFDVIVVDSSASDANAALVGRLAAGAPCSLRCLRKEPEGPGPSRNLGVAESRGPFLAFLDSDCQATAGWLRHGLAAFDDRVGLVQGMTIPEPGVPHSVFNRSLEILQESCFYHTANVFYRRDALEKAGGFRADQRGDRAGIVGGEDTDLAWNVKRDGWQSRFAESAIVIHVVVRMPVLRWFVETQVGTVPLVLSWHPELRPSFFARYFYNRNQALFVLGLLGIVLAPFHLVSLVLWAPWFVDRAWQPSQTLRGPLRLLRPVLYFPRDLTTFLALAWGSLRSRALLL